MNRNGLLLLLAMGIAASSADRMALALALQAIKSDLHLTDAELGLVTGFFFAASYSLASVPIARRADRTGYAPILALASAVSGGAIILCGLVTSFGQLILARALVGLGEAGYSPTAQALIANRVAISERPRALSKYLLGSMLSIIAGYWVGGWLNQTYGWRTMFVVLGVPGLVLSLLIRLLLKDDGKSQDRHSKYPSRNREKHGAFAAVAKELLNNRAYFHLVAGYTLTALLGSCILQWQPSFFIRSYGISTSKLGMLLAITHGLVGSIGVLIGGYWTSHRLFETAGRQTKVMAPMVIVFSILLGAIYVTRSLYLSLIFFGLSGIVMGALSPPLFATALSIVRPQTRATSAAIFNLTAMLIGTAAGPLIAGIVSDCMKPAFGQESLRYALLAVCPLYVWPAMHFWRASLFVDDAIVVASTQAPDRRSKVKSSDAKSRLTKTPRWEVR